MVNKLPPEMESPLDVQLYKQIDTTLHIYKKMYFSPNTLTTISLLFGLSSVYAVYHDYFMIGSILLFIAYALLYYY